MTAIDKISLATLDDDGNVPLEQLGNAPGGADAGVDSFQGRTGAVELTKADVTGTELAAADIDAATASALTDETSRAETAEAELAPKASPTFTGNPVAPTQSPGDNSTKLATTAFVAAAIAAAGLITATQQSGSYTFVLADGGTVVESTDASAATFTIPPNSSVAFPVGAVIEVFQDGAGQVTIAAGGGVTLRSDGGKVATAAQYATIGLRKRATDEWVLSGDLA